MTIDADIPSWVSSLRILIDSLDGLDDEGIYSLGVSLAGYPDDEKADAIECFKEGVTPVEVMTSIIKPALQEDLAYAEDLAVKLMYDVPAWEHPPWLNESQRMSTVIRSLRDKFRKAKHDEMKQGGSRED